MLKCTLKYTYILFLNVSVFDHHKGACTEPVYSYIYIKTFGEITPLIIMRLCGSMLPHNRIIINDVISPNVLT